MRKRDHGVYLRMSSSELDYFKEKLNASGMTQTAFVILAIGGAQIAPKELTAEKQEQNRLILGLLAQLRRLGVNINQLARVANQTGEANVLGELQEYRSQLSELKGEIEQWQFTKSSIPPA